MDSPASPDRKNRFAFLDDLGELPSLPQVVVRISRVASDPSSTAGELADVILRDQALTLKVLKLANSARYALYSQRVTTVSRAVMLLGFQSVRALALGLGAFQLLSTLQKGGGVLEDFWKEAMTSAVICQELADLFSVAVPEEAFVAGLLHDVGKLVLTEHDPEAASDLYDGGLVGPALLSAEREAFGVDHTEVAGELARRWELPEVLQKAMTSHHRHFSSPPVERGDTLAFLVAVAQTLVAPLTVGGDDLRGVAANVARILRKPVGSLIAILQSLPAKIVEYGDFFELQVADLKDYTLWVEAENQRLKDAFTQAEDDRRSVERSRAEMAAVREIHALLIQGGGTDAPLRRVLKAAREAAGSRRTVFALLDPRRQELAQRFADGDVTPDFLDAFRFPVGGEGALAEVVRSRQAINVMDTKMPYFRRLLTTQEVRVIDSPAFAVLPVLRGTEPVGVLYADRNDGDEPFSDGEMETLASLADLASLALRG